MLSKFSQPNSKECIEVSGLSFSWIYIAYWRINITFVIEFNDSIDQLLEISLVSFELKFPHGHRFELHICMSFD